MGFVQRSMRKEQNQSRVQELHFKGKEGSGWWEMGGSGPVPLDHSCYVIGRSNPNPFLLVFTA